MSALDHLASQLQRNQQILQFCPRILVKEPPNMPKERWNLNPRRHKRKGSRNNCLFHSLLILPLFYHHNLLSRTYLVHQQRCKWKLKKYPMRSCWPIKLMAQHKQTNNCERLGQVRNPTETQCAAMKHLWHFVYTCELTCGGHC